ncbi:MAG: hypothetical protein ABIK28_17200, partial [Planctomycetota bacterium]
GDGLRDKNGDSNSNKEDDKTGEEDEDKSSAFDEDEDEDFIFKDPYNVVTRLEEYFDAEFKLEKDIEAEFCSLIEVKSNVFTIYVTVKTPDGRDSKNYRAVIWRRAGNSGSTSTTGDMGSAITGSDEGQIIVLVPLEEYSHPIPYKEGEKEALESYY